MGLSEESSWADVDTDKSQRAVKLEAGSVTLVLRAFEQDEQGYHWLLVCNELGLKYHPLGHMTEDEAKDRALHVATSRLQQMVADINAAAQATGWSG
jgi:hypothetical protein